MMIIGFGHRKRVGKDTASKFLQTHLRIGIRRLNAIKGNLAYPLKQQCHNLWGWAGLREPEFYDTEEGAPHREFILPKLGLTPREVWIQYGNKIREIFPNTWMAWQLDYAKNVIKTDLLILADIRFENEVTAVKQHGGKVYKVIRKDAPISNDVSDCALDNYTDWDGIIENNGSLGDFDRQIKTIVADPIIEAWDESKSA